MTIYNGWANYATWRINLEMLDGFDVEEWSIDINELPDILKDYVESYIIETTSKDVARDYALAFVSDVNYYEIAKHLLADYDESEV